MKYQITESPNGFIPQVSYDGGNTWVTINNTLALTKAGAQGVIDKFNKTLNEKTTPYNPSPDKQPLWD